MASTPARFSQTTCGPNGDPTPHTMTYTCQSCAKRKVKCDKITPICSSCRKSKLECYYQAPPPPRRRRRRLSGDVEDGKLARYEKILYQHGLLPRDTDTPSSLDNIPPNPISVGHEEPGTSNTGRLIAGQGKSRYIDSSLWRDLGEDAMQRMSDDDEQDRDQMGAGTAGDLAPDPLTGAFMGSHQSLLQYHPSHTEATLLWRAHVENVEPICKILHIPSTSRMIEMVSRQPAMASKVDDCLLFAIYHFGVYSLTEEECARSLGGQSRANLLQRYHYAARQALVNASFLKSTEMSVMQALLLFLLAGPYSYDPNTYWILTGVAVRIAQRMGLHRDGESQGLPPFDVQMRRRLFYRLIQLDGVAGQMSGVGVSMLSDMWDTQSPLNIHDEQIWPGMTEPPEAQKGATGMIFCLTRACVGSAFLKAKRLISGAGKSEEAYNDYHALVCEAEKEVEERFIRYCDIINPLHFMTMCLARSAIIAMRIQVRLQGIRNHTSNDTKTKELLQLAQKALDTDAAACANVALKKYIWHVRPFFAWGSWDSLIFLSTSLAQPGAGMLTMAERDAAWSRVVQAYNDHGELLNLKRPLHVAVGRLTVKAWEDNPPSKRLPEPTFVTALQHLRDVRSRGRADRQGVDSMALGAVAHITPSAGTIHGNDGPALTNGLFERVESDVDGNVKVDEVDWAFWDKLIQGYQAQDYEEQDGAQFEV